jgi:hypothetical protein
MSFQSKQVIKRSVLKIDSSAKKIFPLLCPKRELEWIPGWKYEMIYSKSGFNEEGCIFKTKESHGREVVWTTVIYDPEIFKIKFMNFAVGLFILKFEIDLSEKPEKKTEMEVKQTYTSLSKKGNYFLDKIIDELFIKKMKMLEITLNHFLKTGKLMEKEELK